VSVCLCITNAISGEPLFTSTL